jgi:Protein of unknown function (DUF2905)
MRQCCFGARVSTRTANERERGKARCHGGTLRKSSTTESGEHCLSVMQRILVISGLVLIAAGVGWRWISRIPFGHLPGDIHIVREGFSFHFPIVTCIVISVVLSVLIWLFKR